MALFGRKKKKEDEPKTQDAVAKTGSIQTDMPERERTVVVPKSNDETAYRIIRGPHVTEKASTLSTSGAYVFKVDSDANAFDIRRAVETLYKVHVRDVRVINIHPKRRRLGRTVGYRSGYKKAIVTLRAGDSIDIAP